MNADWDLLLCRRCQGPDAQEINGSCDDLYMTCSAYGRRPSAKEQTLHRNRDQGMHQTG